jgi:hypothetical protein
MNEQHINSSTSNALKIKDPFKAQKQDPTESLVTMLTTSTPSESTTRNLQSEKANHLDLQELAHKFDRHMKFSSPRDTNQEEPKRSCRDSQSVDEKNVGFPAIRTTSSLESLKRRYYQDVLSQELGDFNDDDDDEDNDYDSLDSISYYRRSGQLGNKKSNADSLASLYISIPSVVAFSSAADKMSMLPDEMSE